jgi:hypothetical protein
MGYDRRPSLGCSSFLRRRSMLLPLRDQLIDTFRASGANVNEVAQALVDVLMVTIIAAAPDADAAERNLRHVCDDMYANIRRSYEEWHAMAAARRMPRQ